MTQSKTRTPSASTPRRFKLLRCVALSSVLVFAACEAQAQSTRGYGGGMSRGEGGGGGHRGYRGGRGGGGGGGWGGAAAGALIGLGIGIIANEAARANRRTETVVDEYEERPSRRKPPKRRVVEQAPEGYEPTGRRPRKPKPEPRLVATEPRAKVVRAAPQKPEKPSPRAAARNAPPPPTGGRPPAAAPAPIAPAPAVIASGDRFVPDEVICEVRAGTPEAEIVALGQRQRLERISMERFNLTGATVIRYRIQDRRAVASAVSDLLNDPVVASAQPNNIFELSREAASDLSGAQYAAAMMRLGEAHAAATGRGVAIAVIDSAVDVDHPALKGAVVESFDPIGGEVKPHAHGTAIAGLAAGRGDIVSPAPAGEIYAIRAFAPEQKKSGAQGTTYHILRGLDWAAGRGVRVVNMSFAGPRDDKFSEFIAAGAAKGAIYVAAAGNAGPASPPLYPAADPNVIAVTAVDADDGLLNVANRGPHVSVAAPGVDVLVASPGGGFGYLSGTSMASAEIAGLVALLVEARPGLAAWQARAALVRSARDLGAPGPDPEFGAGAADARAALDALDALDQPAEPSTPVAGAPAPSASATPISAASTDVAQRP